MTISSSYEACATIEGFGGYEGAEEEDILEAWQYLIDTGDAFTLQGFYGRNAVALINAGLCLPPDPRRAHVTIN